MEPWQFVRGVVRERECQQLVGELHEPLQRQALEQHLNYTVLSFPGAEDAAEPEVIYTETVVSFVLQDDRDEVARFQRVYDRTWGMTLDAKASVDMIRRAQAKLTT